MGWFIRTPESEIFWTIIAVAIFVVAAIINSKEDEE